MAAPHLPDLAVPLALALLSLLFAVQRSGTAAVGRVFGMVMLVWFAAIAAVGGREVAAHPDVIRGLVADLRARLHLRPSGGRVRRDGRRHAGHPGAEALYADMGHFGRPPIHRAWFWFVFPALTLSYLGQSGLVFATRPPLESPFFLLVPGWAASRWCCWRPPPR